MEDAEDAEDVEAIFVGEMVRVEEVAALDCTDDDEPEIVELKTYTESLFPAPQYSVLSPGHRKLQSVAGATTDPALKESPQ